MPTSIEQLIDQGHGKKGVLWPNQTLRLLYIALQHCLYHSTSTMYPLSIYQWPSTSSTHWRSLRKSLVRSVEPPMLGGDPCASYVSSAMTWTLERQWLKRWRAGEFLLKISSKILETVHGIPILFPQRRLKSSTFATTLKKHVGKTPSYYTFFFETSKVGISKENPTLNPCGSPKPPHFALTLRVSGDAKKLVKTSQKKARVGQNSKMSKMCWKKRKNNTS